MYDNMCLVLDLGGNQGAAIARKVRGLSVYCEVLPYDTPIEQIAARAPRALIVAGGTGNPFREDALKLPDAVYALNLPMLGLGYGAGVLLNHAGARPVRSMAGGQTVEITFSESALFEGITDSERYVGRLDDVELPEGLRSIASMRDWSVAFEDEANKRWGVQFYPEQNDPDGLTILNNFAVKLCGCARDWTSEHFLEAEPERIRAQVGDADVLMAISGGVDSVVCSVLLSKALGKQLSCVYVDTGLMRKGDNDAVRDVFEKVPGLKLQVIDARERFINRLVGVTDAREKSRVIGVELDTVLAEYTRSLGRATFLARGTTYDDLLGDLRNPDEPKAIGPVFCSLIEPVKMLFKDEVRSLGEAMGLPEEFIRRQAFPNAGLAVRCLGAVTHEKLSMLREADRVFREEIMAAGLDRKIRQYFAVLTDLPGNGSNGGNGYTLALRAVNWTGTSAVATAYRLPYDLLERVVERVTGEVEGISRVVYDVTSKPPANIEWE